MTQTQTVQHVDIIPRQCGTRHDGAAYMVEDPIVDLETLKHFLINDGQAYPTSELDLCAQGMNPIMRPGTEDDPIYDFYDVIGGDYEWVWDVIKEMMVLGPSRKFPKNHLNLVDPDGRSMWIAVHDKAITDIGNTVQELQHFQQPLKGDQEVKGENEYVRRLECGSEYVAGQMRDIPVQYEQGAFLWMPITRFEVVEDVTSQTHGDAIDKLGDLGFDFSLVDN